MDRLLCYRLGFRTLAHLLYCLALHIVQVLAWFNPKVLLDEKCKTCQLKTDQRLSDWQENDGKTISHEVENFKEGLTTDYSQACRNKFR